MNHWARMFIFMRGFFERRCCAKMYDEILSKINRIMENYQEEEKYNIFDVLDVTYKEVPMCRFWQIF